MSAITLTFDNLGEATALERGTHDPARPLGRDPSVTDALPRLLDELDRHDLKGTFFVEAINCELNPDALLTIARRGHELGVHGWRHEPWAQLDPETERALLERSTSAFAAIGLPAPRGFRPPGGRPTPQTAELLRTRGFSWWSPQADDPAPGPQRGLVTLPFSWDRVDAYHLMESFSPLRRERGDAAEPADAAELGERLLPRRDGGVTTLILHPFLMLDPAWRAGAARLLAHLAADDASWIVPGGTLARWLAR